MSLFSFHSKVPPPRATTARVTMRSGVFMRKTSLSSVAVKDRMVSTAYSTARSRKDSSRCRCCGSSDAVTASGVVTIPVVAAAEPSADVDVAGDVVGLLGGGGPTAPCIVRRVNSSIRLFPATATRRVGFLA